MNATVTIEISGIELTCDVFIFGPTSDQWEFVSVITNGDIKELLKQMAALSWTHFDALTALVSDALVEEHYVRRA